MGEVGLPLNLGLKMFELMVGVWEIFVPRRHASVSSEENVSRVGKTRYRHRYT